MSDPDPDWEPASESARACRGVRREPRIDLRRSYDIKYLTELEFVGSHVQFQQMPFTQTDLNLERSSVDAAISNADHLSRLMGKEFSSRPLSPKVQAISGDRDTSAAVLVKGGDIATRAVLTEILRTDDILHIQQKVVEGLIVPRY
ncbi:MAG: hypothetical protein CUN53_15735 [Phototrophicales bacterium]|nr:MAG: hypothetical protein CUN53_15735 [Phototrophicales bacterium]